MEGLPKQEFGWNLMKPEGAYVSLSNFPLKLSMAFFPRVLSTTLNTVAVSSTGTPLGLLDDGQSTLLWEMASSWQPSGHGWAIIFSIGSLRNTLIV